MRTITLLADMETSRYRPFMLGNRKSNYKWIFLGIFALLIMSMVMMSGFTTANGLLLTGVLNVFTALILFVIIDSIQLSPRQEREWWLLFPHPRLSLVLGRALGLFRVGVQLFLYFAIIRMVQYALSVGLLHQMQAIAWSEVLYILEAEALLLIAGLPIIVSVGLILTVFQVWWVRSLFILVMMYLFMPSLIFTFMAGNADVALTTLSPSVVSRFAVKLLLIGWPFSVLCIWFTSAVGMRQMGKASSSNSSFALQDVGARQSPLLEKKVEQSGKGRTPFWSLVAMERRRYRWFGLHNNRLGSILAGVLMTAIAVIGYQSAAEVFELVSFFSMIMIGSYMVSVIYYLNRQIEFMKGHATWWIMMPHSRRLLLGSRVVAYLSVILPYLASLLLSAGIGAAVRQWIDPMPREELLVALQYFSHYALVFIPLIILYIIALQGFPAFLKRSWLMIFAAPLYGGYILGFQLANVIITPRRLDGLSFRSGPAPDFSYHLLLIYGTVIPYALFCFWLGCKYMHRYSLAKDTILLGKMNK